MNLRQTHAWLRLAYAASLPGPTNLQAIQVAGGISLTWDTLQGAAGYRVFRSLRRTGGYVNITPNNGQLLTSLLDATVDAGTVYYYYVVAYNTGGDSPASSIVSVVTPDAEVASVVGAISAPTELHLFGVASKDVHVYWNDGDKVDLKRFVVQRTIKGANNWQSISTINPAATTRGVMPAQRIPVRHHVDRNLVPGEYSYRVRAEYGNLVDLSPVFDVLLEGGEYYVHDTAGNDTTGDGSQAKPWKTLQKGFSSVEASKGHRINFTGDFELTQRLNVTQGVSLRGTGQTQSIIRFYQNQTFDFALSALAFENPARFDLVDMNVEYANFSIEGGRVDPLTQLHNKEGRRGILFRSVKGCTFDSIKIQKTYFAGLELRYDSEYIAIKNSTFLNAGYTPPIGNDPWPKEAGPSGEDTTHYGGIYVKGSARNLFITDCDGEYLDGYYIKVQCSFERLQNGVHQDLVENIIIRNCTAIGGLRNWNNTDAAEFFVEVWNVTALRCAYYNNKSKNQYSFEFINRLRALNTYSHLLCDCLVEVEQASALELSTHDAIIDNCIFYYKNGHNVFEGVGDYNPKPLNQGADNVKILRCLFLFLNRPAPILSSRNIFTNLKIWNCTGVYDSLPAQLINLVNPIGYTQNDNWPGLEVKNVAIICPDVSRADFRLVRRTGNNTVENQGDGVPTLPGAQISHLMVNTQPVYPPLEATVNLIQAAPQVQGGTDILQAYRPAPVSNLIASGTPIAEMPHSGSVPPIGCYDIGLSSSSTLLRRLTVPTVPLVGVGVVGSDAIELAWTDNGKADFYRLKVSEDEGFEVFREWSVAASPYRITSLLADTVYYIQLQGANAAGLSAPSQVLEVKTDQGDMRQLVLAVNCNGVERTFEGVTHQEHSGSAAPANADRGTAYGGAVSLGVTDPAASGEKLLACGEYFYNLENYRISGLANGNYQLETYTLHRYNGASQTLRLYPNADGNDSGAVDFTITPTNSNADNLVRTVIPFTVTSGVLRMSEPTAIGAPEGGLKLCYFRLYKV